MASYLSPGVFIEEFVSDTQVVQGVSTSTVGVVGFTPQGPTNVATLVTSYPQFETTFGGLTHNSHVGYNMAAFFANGGSAAYVVRVVPSDAVAASAKIISQITNQVVGVGDGTTVNFATTAAASTITLAALEANSGASPVRNNSISLSWRGAGTPVTGTTGNAILADRGGVTAVAPDGTATKFEFRIKTAALVGFSSGLMQVVPGATTFKWTTSTMLTSLVIPAPVSGTVTTATSGSGATLATVIFDHATGIGSASFGASVIPDAASSLVMDFTPTTATEGTSDNGAGVLTAGSVLSGPGTVSITDGSYSFTTNSGASIPHNLGNILATYKVAAWSLAPISKGAWTNNLQVVTSGSADSYNPTTGQYGSINTQILLQDSSGNFNTVESYEDLVAGPTTDPSYFAEVINSLSSYITVAEPAGNMIPGTLLGIACSQVIAGGDESTLGKAVSVTLVGAPVNPLSLSIVYTDNAGVVQTITDDGITGALVGAGVAAGGTVVYSTGVLSFSTALPIKVGTLMTVTFATAPAETTHTELFGDVTLGYTVGSDGTFTSGTYGRNQLTDMDLLSAGYLGLYALNKVDDTMSVIVPDAAGDTTMTGDLLDYASSRASQNSGGDRFIILTVPKGSSATQSTNWLRYTLARNSDYAAVYWPWIRVADPLSNNRSYTIPPLGHIAGIYARTDSTKNVGKSPGGTVDGALNYLIGLETNPTQGDRDAVYPLRVNPLINTPQTGMAVWGVRTISATSTWRYVSARRLFMFVEKSVYNSTQWIVFESNGPALWTQIKAQLNGFLGNLFQQGYFAGTSAAQAFFVICDSSNNTPDSINSGVVNITVGIAPNKPAEFVVFRFTQVAS